ARRGVIGGSYGDVEGADALAILFDVELAIADVDEHADGRVLVRHRGRLGLRLCAHEREAGGEQASGERCADISLLHVLLRGHSAMRPECRKRLLWRSLCRNGTMGPGVMAAHRTW